MSANQGDIQERIAAARREAESLKEKIRAKKESSADTSCPYLLSFLCLTRRAHVFRRMTFQCGKSQPKSSLYPELPCVRDAHSRGISRRSTLCIGQLIVDILSPPLRTENSSSGTPTRLTRFMPSRSVRVGS